MKYKSHALLESLSEDVRKIILQAGRLESLPAKLLQQQPSAGKWSVAQILDHLNIYARYYINAIEGKLHHNQSGADIYFQPGWLGNYFTKIMQPRDDKSIPNKMQAPKNAVPQPQPDAVKVLREFVSHQHQLLNLLAIAETANLNYIRIPTSLYAFIKLKLGDTFRFLVAHEQRHFVQIENVLNVVNSGQELIIVKS